MREEEEQQQQQQDDQEQEGQEGQEEEWQEEGEGGGAGGGRGRSRSSTVSWDGWDITQTGFVARRGRKLDPSRVRAQPRQDRIRCHWAVTVDSAPLGSAEGGQGGAFTFREVQVSRGEQRTKAAGVRVAYRRWPRA